MGPKRFSTVFALLLLIGVVQSSATRDRGLIGDIEAFRVIVTESGDEDFLPADRAYPKDIIEYRLTYRNMGESAVRHIFITDPIRSGTEYVEESASRPENGRVEFSVDQGKTFHDWPIRVRRRFANGRIVVTEATPGMVTHIRWVLTDTFDPDSKVTVSYRTLIK